MLSVQQKAAVERERREKVQERELTGPKYFDKLAPASPSARRGLPA